MSTLRVNRIQAIDESVLNFDTGDINSSGIVTATEFSGSGSSLTNLPAGNLTGALPAIDGSALTGIVSIPTGVIVMWSGSIASIPSGWALCDGTSGTPDLRDRFVVGAGNGYAVAATGGSADAVVVSHSHTASSTSTVSDPGHSHSGSTNTVGNHSHSYSTNQGTGGGQGGGGADTGSRGATTGGGGSHNHTVTINSNTTGITVSTSTSVSNTGSSGTNANLPPYYALAFIMKT